MNSHTFNNSQSLFDSIKTTQSESVDTAMTKHSPVQGRRLPPVEKWQPTHIVPFNIVIQDNGEWWHDGTRITRQALIDVFSSVLWMEVDTDGQRHYYLKTPSDKYEISVIDVPLFINTVQTETIDGVDVIVFGTQHGDKVALSVDNILYFKDFTMPDGTVQERLYIDMHHGLPARIERHVLHHLVQMGELSQTDGRVSLTLTSGERMFVLTSRELMED